MFSKSIFDLTHGAYIVTGGSGFLGRAHCHAIAAFGGTPIILDLNKSASDILLEEIKSEHDVRAQVYPIDITSKEELLKVLAEITKSLPIKGLVNNAARNPVVSRTGLETSSRLENFSLEDWDKDINVGLKGSFLCTQVFGSHMNEFQGGSIVNISSDLGIIAPKQSLYKIENKNESEQPVKPVTYSIVKTGLIGLTRYTASYWPTKIRCNCLCPGGIENNQSQSFLNKVCAEIPLGRLAKLDEYGGALIFLLSSASSYMNGAIISIDGGRTTW